MELAEAIAALDRAVPDPRRGLPDEVFSFVSRTTPLVNVDLLVRDERGRTLLAWRDDPLDGTGWHVPGGIVRFQETLEARLRAVAETEIGATVAFEPVPVALHAAMQPERGLRGHFLSVLYRGFLTGDFVPRNEGRSPRDPGYLRWHAGCPEDLLPCQAMYRDHLAGGGPGR